MTETESRVKELWTLLLQKPTNLTDAQIHQLLDWQEELKKCIQDVSERFPQAIEAAKEYRSKKRELDSLSTKDLQEMSTIIVGLLSDRIEKT